MIRWGIWGNRVSRLRDLWERGHITDAEMGAYLRQIESQTMTDDLHLDKGGGHDNPPSGVL